MAKLFKGRTAVAIGAVLLAVSLSGYLLLSGKNKTDIKIGLIIPLSGPASQHKVVADAIFLAAEEINLAGGINGRKLKLILKDSRSDKSAGKKVFNEIERQHKPLLYISTTSTVSLALAPLAEANQVVLVGLVVASPALTRQKKWVFKYFVSAEHEAKPIMHILKQLNVNRLGILYQDDAFGISQHTLIQDAFEKAGGHVVSRAFDPKAADFETGLAPLKAAQAIYIAGFVNTVGKAINKLRADKYHGILLSHSGCTSLPRSMPGINNIYVAAPIIYNPNYVFAQEAKKRYEARYGHLFTHQAANGYDVIKILAGLLAGRKLTRETVRGMLEDGFSYPGILGYIEKQKGDHDIHFPLYPARIVNGEITYLQ